MPYIYQHTIHFTTFAFLAGFFTQMSLEEGSGLLIFPSVAWIGIVWFFERVYKEDE